MTVRRRTWLAVTIACLVALCAAVVAGARSSERSPAATTSAAKPAVGTLALVQGLVLDLHLGAKRAVRVGNGAAVRVGDVLTPKNGASARVLFTSAAKRHKRVLFTLQAPHAATQRILLGAASLGPRLAFAYDGKSIATVVGKGLDAVAHVTVQPAGSRKVRLQLTAPGTLDPTFACAIDRGRYATCASSQVVRLAAGRHTVAVRTTSLFGFHGPRTTRKFVATR